jgi:hypothetical protein
VASLVPDHGSQPHSSAAVSIRQRAAWSWRGSVHCSVTLPVALLQWPVTIIRTSIYNERRKSFYDSADWPIHFFFPHELFYLFSQSKLLTRRMYSLRSMLYFALSKCLPLCCSNLQARRVFFVTCPLFTLADYSTYPYVRKVPITADSGVVNVARRDKKERKIYKWTTILTIQGASQPPLRSTISLQKPMVVQLVNKFPDICETRSAITMFTKREMHAVHTLIPVL